MRILAGLNCGRVGAIRRRNCAASRTCGEQREEAGKHLVYWHICTVLGVSAIKRVVGSKLYLRLVELCFIFSSSEMF